VPIDVERLREDIVFTARLRELDLVFHSTWGLFSPREIDDGSRLLLDYVELAPDDDCLDLGCGYGPIGVTMARLAPRGRTWLVDKDFVAVEYARKNAERNRATNTEVRLSNGFDQVEGRFQVIAANLPAKTGKELLQLLLHDARAHLAPGGRLYVVTISGLRRFIERNVNEVFGNYKKLKQGRSFTVALGELRE
jgi:16S rRNA G1207 methylase RsmC